MPLRVIVADDEPLARARLRRLLSAEADVEIVAECSDGASAAEAIRRFRPDVVLLDIQMPELDGFEVIEDLDGARPPAVIFVTAYDRHAIRAFDAAALDYLLKPVEAPRLHRAIERARVHVRQGDIEGKLASILANVRGGRGTIDRIAVRGRGRVAFIRTSDVLWIEAAGNYARVHAASETALVRDTLTNLEAKLDDRHFVRIHRSTIVNIAKVKELRPWFAGDYVVVMEDGKELTLSRTHREHAGPKLGL